MFLGFDRIGGSRSRRSENGGQDMGSQNDFFEALGPTPPPPNDSPGFFTNATRIWRGVDVVGKQLGVRGRGGDAGSVGVEGHGGPGGNGVFGQGMNGIVGLSAAAVRNPATEASEPAGVFGVGDGSSAVGVRGESIGPNAGVVGISHSVGGVGAGPGVRALSDDGIGVAAKGDTGVHSQGERYGVEAYSDGGTGVYTRTTRGVGLQAYSKESQAGVFESEYRAQIRLIPSNSQRDPSQFPQSELGDLAVTFADPPSPPSLWFCIVAGGPGQSQWKKIA
jgi:hypothetical protein